jgi:hypothetical protein
MPTRAFNRALRQPTWLALIIVYIAWGSTYVAIRVMDETVPPLIGGGIRFTRGWPCTRSSAGVAGTLRA